MPKDLSESKYQFLIKKLKDAVIKQIRLSKCVYRIFKHYGLCLQ